jgi:alkylation response protein AidB-like acyl-CoA dehydrogenase
LGAAAVDATGTPEQRERFLTRFSAEKPVLACMAMTEPHCGSDTAAIRTRAVRDGDSWILNGEKIFVTAGNKSLVDTPWFVVVWATIDPSAGRAGMRPFVVEANTPGCRVKLEAGASSDGQIVLEDCRGFRESVGVSRSKPEASRDGTRRHGHGLGLPWRPGRRSPSRSGYGFGPGALTNPSASRRWKRCPPG